MKGYAEIIQKQEGLLNFSSSHFGETIKLVDSEGRVWGWGVYFFHNKKYIKMF